MLLFALAAGTLVDLALGSFLYFVSAESLGLLTASAVLFVRLAGALTIALGLLEASSIIRSSPNVLWTVGIAHTLRIAAIVPYLIASGAQAKPAALWVLVGIFGMLTLLIALSSSRHKARI